MAYNTEVFEKAILKKGYVIEEMRKSSPLAVESVKGAVTQGTLTKQVWWNKDGKCFSYRRTRLPKYDLPLEEIENRLTDKT